MKKLIAMLLALAMVLSLGACTEPGSGGKDDSDKEQEQEKEYPIVVEFELNDMDYTMTLEDEKNICVSVDRNVITEDDLADMDIEVESATVVIKMNMKGTYKERKGVCTATLDTCTYTMHISGKDKNAVREGLLEYFEDNDVPEFLVELVDGKEVDVTEEMEYPGGTVAFELDDDELVSFIVYEEDGETISEEYTFHSNGKVKKKIEYRDGEPDYYWTYDKDGNVIDSGDVEDENPNVTVPNDPVNTQPPTAVPGPAETEPTISPTEPVEMLVYNITVWASGQIADQICQQIDEFNYTNDYGIWFNATIEGVSEGDAASSMIADVASGPDLYCFAQDQTARLVQAGALSELDWDGAKFVCDNNGAVSINAALMDGTYWAYPMTSDNGYFMYYDKSVISEDQVDSLEALIAACEASGRGFSFELENSWYMASFFFAAGCDSEWYVDAYGDFTGFYDTFNTNAGKIAGEAMKKLLNSSCYVNSSWTGDFESAYPSAVVISGIWNYENAKAILGDNLGVADLPGFTADGVSYHLGSFSGCKLMGVKPQYDSDKEWALHLLAQYLTGEQCQMERFEGYGWGPSNMNAQESESVKSSPALVALLEQNRYAKPQGQIHGSWWDIAKNIAISIKSGTSVEDALNDYSEALNSLLG